MNLSDNHRELYIVESFKNLLSAVIICYQKSLLSNNAEFKNDENYIRNMLVDEYLEDSLTKEELQIENYKFIAEPASIRDRLYRYNDNCKRVVLFW